MSVQNIKGSVSKLPVVDNTLTRSGYSADAKATGDAIAENKQRIESEAARLDSELDVEREKINQIANNQIPDEYLKASVDAYVTENSGGFATKSDLSNFAIESKEVEWEKGSIVDGVPSNSNTTCRSTDYVFMPSGSKISIQGIPDEYNVTIYMYTNKNAESYTSYKSITVEKNVSQEYVVESDIYVRLRFYYFDGRELTSEDIATLSNIYYLRPKMITDIEYIAELAKNMENGFFEWEKGGITAGKPTNSDAYFRTKDFTFMPKGSQIVLDGSDIDAYRCSVYIYSEPSADTYISASAVIVAKNGEGVYTLENDYYLKMRWCYTDYRVLTDTDFENMPVITYIRPSNSDLRVRVSELEKQKNNVEKFYLPTAWTKDISSIQKLQGNKFTFGVQTDTHFSLYEKKDVEGNVYVANDNNHITPFKNLTNYIGFDFICNLGDMIRGYQFDSDVEARASMTEAVNRYTENVGCPVLFAIGNHDDNAMYTVDSTVGSGNHSLDEVLVGKELYAKMIAPSRNTSARQFVQNGKSNYYYMDFNEVRVIVLDTRDIPFNVLSGTDITINNHKISEEQYTWFSNVALQTEKKVVVLSHVPLLNSLISSNNTVANADYVLNALATFKNKGGTVIGCFCGHVHEQNSATDASGILHVTFESGGNFAEIVMVDTDNNTIETKLVGNFPSALVGRNFTY